MNDGVYWIASQFLDEPTILEMHAQRKDKSPEWHIIDALAVAIRVRTILELAHAFGVLHGNLRPACILIRGLSNDCDPCLLELGYADLFALNRTAACASPRYRPPEQITGAPIDARSDIPEIQPVTLCSKKSCGGIDWFVNFALPVPAATDGWVVQEVVYKKDVTGPGAIPLQDHYWEAFWFPAGSTGHVCVNALSDDAYGQDPGKSGTIGTATWMGKAKFYEGTLPADFMRDPDPLKSPATVLRYTRTQPAFWDGTGTAHDLTLTWDCSDPGNPVDSVQSSVPPDDCLKP